MSAHGIKLKPMKMADSKYVPPSKRSKVPDTVELSDKNFPSFGSLIPSKPNNLENPKENKQTLSDKIKETIRLSILADEERGKDVKDLSTMTRENLIAEGWEILDLRSAKNISLSVDPLLDSYYIEADSGMEFYEYCMYKN